MRHDLLKAALLCFAVAAVLLWLLFVSGCSTLRRIVTPAASVTTPTGAVLTQSGDAMVPASVSTKTATASIMVPAQSIVWQNAATGALEYRLAKDSALTTVTKTEEAKAPTAFSPPVPPTPAELSDGKMVLVYRIGLVAGIAAALFGLVRDYTLVMIGGSCVAGACLVGLFIQSHPILMVVIGLGIAAAIVGPYVWHAYLKHLPANKPTP